VPEYAAQSLQIRLQWRTGAVAREAREYDLPREVAGALLANPGAACRNSDGETNCSQSFSHAAAIP
jgi:hypothetical protein